MGYVYPFNGRTINSYFCIVKMKDRRRNEKQHKSSSAVKLKRHIIRCEAFKHKSAMKL